MQGIARWRTPIFPTGPPPVSDPLVRGAGQVRTMSSPLNTCLLLCLRSYTAFLLMDEQPGTAIA
jgi:hypothetical protein